MTVYWYDAKTAKSARAIGLHAYDPRWTEEGPH